MNTSYFLIVFIAFELIVWNKTISPLLFGNITWNNLSKICFFYQNQITLTGTDYKTLRLKETTAKSVYVPFCVNINVYPLFTITGNDKLLHQMHTSILSKIT